MAKREQQQEREGEDKPWGTLEELLLACAVNRHGTERWDSIAVEVQNRTPSLRSLTSQNCIDKFNDLKRRFMPQHGNDGTTTANGLVDQLRRIRVEELRREVRRRDVSIVSLELKVKRLKAERDRSLKEEADLAVEKNLSPPMIAGKSASGNDSGYERSFDESNSTSQQIAETTMRKELNDNADLAANMKPELEPEPEIKNEPDHRLSRSEPKVEPHLSPNGNLEEDGDDNNNDRNDYADEEPSGKEEIEMKRSPTARIGDSNELGESVGESKREDKEKEKQNSDVQSSAGLSLKKKKRRRRGRGGEPGDKGGGAGAGCSSGEEPEVSPATRRLSVSAVKSEPLLKLLGNIRSHRLGSVFERRLKNQESQKYKNLVRERIDLHIVQSRLEEGVYSTCIQKFFRDLLLLFNNATTFFRRNSPEYLAALELRSLVQKEMAERPLRVIAKTEPEQKPKPAPNMKPIMMVCSTRTSGRQPSDNTSKKGDRKNTRAEEKPRVCEKKIETSRIKNDEKGVRNKQSRDTSVSVPGNSRSSNKSEKEARHQFGGNELSSHDNFEAKADRKESSGRKRQGAASFLRRMKQNSPSEVTDNEDDSSEDESKNGKEDVKKDVKKKGGKDRNGIREVVTRSSRARIAKEESEKPKRIGRPPKRPPESVVVKGKRGRNGIDSEVGGGGAGRARKKPRR